MYEVKDKVFLVTGGAAGIGEGIVREFLEEGAKHVRILDVNVTGGTQLQNELSSKYGGDKIKFQHCDITTDDLDTAFDNLVEDLGYVDVVVNCAGLMNDSPRVYKKAIAVNVTALITSSLKAYELMRVDKGGRGGTIINIASIVALMKSPFLPIYNATKSAVLQFSQCLGMEPTYSRTEVRVLTVCFGCTDTELLSKSKAEVYDAAFDDILFEALKHMPLQTPQSAVAGLVEAYKGGASASTWLVTSDKPAVDITGNVDEAYRILGQGVMEK